MIGHLFLEAGHDQRARHAGQSHDRADGQIEAAHHENEHLADSKNHQIGRTAQNIQNVRQDEEMRHEDREQHDEPQQHDRQEADRAVETVEFIEGDIRRRAAVVRAIRHHVAIRAAQGRGPVFKPLFPGRSTRIFWSR